MSRTIELTQNQVAIVSDSDYEWLSKFKWFARLDHNGTYYAVRKQHQQTILMARELLGAQPGEEVDHINGDTLDNRRCNLRLCSHAENAYNQKKTRRLCTSRYKGCCWNKLARKWMARIRYRGRRIHLGMFHDEAEAALAYDGAAVRLFAAFACLNFPFPHERSAIQTEGA